MERVEVEGGQLEEVEPRLAARLQLSGVLAGLRRVRRAVLVDGGRAAPPLAVAVLLPGKALVAWPSRPGPGSTLVESALLADRFSLGLLQCGFSTLVDQAGFVVIKRSNLVGSVERAPIGCVLWASTAPPARHTQTATASLAQTLLLIRVGSHTFTQAPAIKTIANLEQQWAMIQE